MSLNETIKSTNYCSSAENHIYVPNKSSKSNSSSAKAQAQSFKAISEYNFTNK